MKTAWETRALVGKTAARTVERWFHGCYFMPATRTGKPLRLTAHMQMFFTAQVTYVDAAKGYKKKQRKYREGHDQQTRKIVYDYRISELA